MMCLAGERQKRFSFLPWKGFCRDDFKRTYVFAVEFSSSWKGNLPMHKDKKNSSALHRSWKVWFAVVVMLAAVLMYVLTLDDSVVPTFLN
jgi:hypothetical protein